MPAELTDVARFRPEDPEALVAASFACPCCLLCDCDVAVEQTQFDAEAECRCRVCGQEHAVELDPQQVLRLALSPPPRRAGGWTTLRLRFRDAAA